MTIYYVVALLIAFYFLLIAEFFLPTGGVLGAASVAALAAAVTIAFSHSMFAGIITLVFTLITTPLVLFGMLRAWPHTPIGRRMLNRRPGELARQPVQRTTSHGRPIGELVGHIGTSKTDLLPSGLVTIDGEKMDCVSTGMPIDAGTAVIVTSVEAGHVHVRVATGEDLADKVEPTPQSPPSLEESLESFDSE